jgi:hypothetical protein
MSPLLQLLQKVHSLLLFFGFQYQKPESYYRDRVIIKVFIDHDFIKINYGSSEEDSHRTW